MKICTKCDVEKEEDQFSKGKYYCKSCIKEYRRNYYLVNKKNELEYLKKYRAAHPDRSVESKIYYSKHRQSVNIRSRNYFLSHKTDRLKYSREYYRKHRSLLSDYYMVKCLGWKLPICQSIFWEYPQLLLLKRLEIKTKRLLKN